MSDSNPPAGSNTLYLPKLINNNDRKNDNINTSQEKDLSIMEHKLSVSQQNLSNL